MARLGGDGLGQRSQQDAGIPRGRVSSKDTCELLTKEALLGWNSAAGDGPSKNECLGPIPCPANKIK